MLPNFNFPAIIIKLLKEFAKFLRGIAHQLVGRDQSQDLLVLNDSVFHELMNEKGFTSDLRIETDIAEFGMGKKAPSGPPNPEWVFIRGNDNKRSLNMKNICYN